MSEMRSKVNVVSEAHDIDVVSLLHLLKLVCVLVYLELLDNQK